MAITAIIMAIFGPLWIMGALFLNYNIYKLVLIDAKARKMKRPRLWALLSMGHNNGSAFLPIYFFNRRKYPRKAFSPQEAENYERYKKQAKVSLALFLIGAVVFFICFIHYFKIWE
ncbi:MULTISPECIES: hypothetical protein [Aerococcus]|uniref:hypothetical protein n=1 Tax=Aerococcus TaxID=1375 RepID=UPI0018A7773D|nr:MULTISPECIES: hypothetical protein [Aerococcus]MCY3035604.1 hypothetical protein [Aerococcus sp. Group 2]MCY3039278.1 hypothetical protein [Aerococcus sp. Group 2]MCY3041180.1 hypothetical protein [Aerococcus sp. Group 2]MCY3042417.1 hypothetical protein [Aerococcus sp. Group 2]MDK6520963.1 hypothetical protein [Aerococcus urinae]